MTNQRSFPHQRLDAYVAARAMAKAVYDARIRDTELRDQAQRAGASVFLLLSEGLPCDQPKMRANYFARARAPLDREARHARSARRALAEPTRARVGRRRASDGEKALGRSFVTSQSRRSRR